MDRTGRNDGVAKALSTGSHLVHLIRPAPSHVVGMEDILYLASRATRSRLEASITEQRQAKERE